MSKGSYNLAPGGAECYVLGYPSKKQMPRMSVMSSYWHKRVDGARESEGGKSHHLAWALHSWVLRRAHIGMVQLTLIPGTCAIITLEKD